MLLIFKTKLLLEAVNTKRYSILDVVVIVAVVESSVMVSGGDGGCRFFSAAVSRTLLSHDGRAVSRTLRSHDGRTWIWEISVKLEDHTNLCNSLDQVLTDG